jgi:hypothetical protein
MKITNLIRKHNEAAKLAGFMSIYWSTQVCDLSNGRSPEIIQGSREG